MDAKEKSEIIKETHRIKAITLFQKLEPEARKYVRKLIESNQINYYAYNCRKDELAKILLAAIIQKITSEILLQLKNKRDMALFNQLLNFLYREEK